MMIHELKDLARHRAKLKSGQFHPNHADFYAKRAARHDPFDPHVYARTRSALMAGSITPRDIPRRKGDEPGIHDN